MKAGQRVRLIGITPDLIASGVKLGMTGTVRVEGPDLLGQPGFIGVEFDGHSDTGWNRGLYLTCINTRRDGQTIAVLSLCEQIGGAS
jgi:hypothetical protein